MTFAKKSLGQHFLHDKNICNKIVDLLLVQEKDAILEIGPGTGAITNILKLLPFSSFLILEKDDRFAKLHSENALENVSVIHIDALQFNWQSLDKNDGNKIKIISNLPYNVASPLMWDIVSLTPNLERAVFMIQNEVADRCVAKVNTSAYGILTVWLQAFCEVKKEFVVNPGAFSPPPKVDSAVISLVPRAKENLPKNSKLLANLVKVCFGQRRKQIQSILKKSQFAHNHQKILELFAKYNIQATARAETIPVSTFIAVADELSN